MPVQSAPNSTLSTAWDRPPSSAKLGKKKGSPLTVLVVFVMIALAVSGVWRATHNNDSKNFVKVIAVNRDVSPGARIDFLNVHYFDVPKELVTQDMMTDLSAISGKVAKTFMPAGEPVKTWMLFDKKDVSLTLETHERALTLQLNDDALVDHLILPEDRVDIICVTSKEGKKYSKTICQAARVMIAHPKEEATSRLARSNEMNKITLAVEADVAEAITEAAEAGKIKLILRNRLSRVVQNLKGVGPDDLLPASALTEPAKTSPGDSQNTLKEPLLAPLPPLPGPPDMPPVDQPKELVKWVVEMFSGDKRNLYEIPKN